MSTWRSLKRVAIGLACVLVLFAIVGYLLVPVVVRHQLEEYLSAQLDRNTTIEAVRFDPFRLHLVIENLLVAATRRAGPNETPASASADAAAPAAAASASAPPPPLFSLARLEARASWRSLTERAPVVSSLQLSEPALRSSRDANGRYAFQDVIERWQAAAAAEAASASASAPPRAPASAPGSNADTAPAIAGFSIANIELTDGRIEFDDAMHRQQHRVESLHLRIPFISSLAVDQAIFVEPGLAAKINGSAFDLSGKAKPFSPNRESTLELSLADVDLSRYLGYSPVPLPVKLVSGSAALRSTIEFAQPPSGRPSMTIRADATLNHPDVRELNDRPLLKAESVRLAGMVLKPLDASYELDTVRLFGPQITVRRLAADDGWFASLRTPPASPEKTPPQWRVAHLQVQSGLIDYRDEQFKPRALAEQLLNVTISADGLSSDQASPVSFKASHDTARNEASEVEGKVRLKPFEIEGDARIFRLKLKDWWWIAQPQLNFTLTDGQLDSSVHFKVAQAQERTDLKLNDLGFHLSRMKLQHDADKLEFLTVPELKASRASFDLASRRIDAGQIESSNATLELRRDGDGKLNLAKLLADHAVPGAAASGTSGGAKSGTIAVAAAKAAAAKTAGAPASAPQPPWIFTVGSLRAEHYSLGFKDAIAGRAADAKLTDFSIHLEKLSTEPGARGRVSVAGRINGEGQASVDGQIALEPLAMKLHVDVKRLGIVPLQPYIAPYLNAMVTRGALQAEGDLSVDAGRPQAGAAAAPKPVIGYQGTLALTDFDLVGKDGRQRLARWQTLRVDRVKAVSEPLRVAVGEVQVKDLQARAVLDSQGKLNLRQVLVAQTPDRTDARDGPDGTEADPKSNQRAPGAAASEPVTDKLSFEQVTIDNAAIDFSDQFVTPNFRARLTQLSGKVSSMSPTKAGDIALRGLVNETGRIEVSGQVNPLAKSLFLDLQIAAHDVELPGMSPYAQKYVGYGIEKGKLSAQLKYTLQDRALKAENHVILNQLTFGARVESPTAIRAPVLFAVSLLQDRNGVIDVNLPVQGTLDDPKFSVGGVVLQVIGNLIAKAASAPFSLIAGLVGRSEQELSKVEFAPGAARLDEDAHARLKAIAKALEERPALKVDLAGHADPQRDAEAIKQRRLERMLKVEKLKDTVGSGADSPDKVTLDSAEYERYLRRAFDAAALEKPRDGQGKVREPSVEQMRSLLAEKVSVSDNDLSALASARAMAAKQWLQTEGGVDGERLFVVTGGSEPLAGHRGDGGESGSAPLVERGGTVELKLK